MHTNSIKTSTVPASHFFLRNRIKRKRERAFPRAGVRTGGPAHLYPSLTHPSLLILPYVPSTIAVGSSSFQARNGRSQISIWFFWILYSNYSHHFRQSLFGCLCFVFTRPSCPATSRQGPKVAWPELRCKFCSLLWLCHCQWKIWEGSFLLVCWSCRGSSIQASSSLA